jgi:hypothetical protein
MKRKRIELPREITRLLQTNDVQTAFDNLNLNLDEMHAIAREYVNSFPEDERDDVRYKLKQELFGELGVVMLTASSYGDQRDFSVESAYLAEAIFNPSRIIPLKLRTGLLLLNYYRLIPDALEDPRDWDAIIEKLKHFLQTQYFRD